MTTLQFVELTGTLHKNVLAKTRKLFEDLGITPAEFSAVYTDTNGQQQTMFALNKDLAVTLAGQYEPKIAYEVAKAFNKQTQPKPLMSLDAIGLLVDHLKQQELVQIEHTKKLAEHEQLVVSTNSGLSLGLRPILEVKYALKAPLAAATLKALFTEYGLLPTRRKSVEYWDVAECIDAYEDILNSAIEVSSKTLEYVGIRFRKPNM